MAEFEEFDEEEEEGMDKFEINSGEEMFDQNEMQMMEGDSSAREDLIGESPPSNDIDQDRVPDNE